jgi:DNA-binding winged helix-turn-helix (wHTH) protein/tetratricopeptide (TPR) repeat protein
MPAAGTLHFCGFAIDGRRASLRSPAGEEIRLRPKSFDMLLFFVANAGRVISKQELFDAIWPNIHVGEDSLFQCIREIRAALGDDRRQLIKLVSGRGYLFPAEVSGEPTHGGAPASDPTSPGPPVGLGPLAGPAGEASRAPAEEARLSMLQARRPWTGAPRRGGWRSRLIPGALAAALVLTASARIFEPRWLTAPTRPLVAVMPIVLANSDPQTAQLATNLTERLSDGLSRIGNIRVVAPGLGEGAGAARHAQASYLIIGELQHSAGSWEARARIVEAASGELLWTNAFAVDGADADGLHLQHRLVGALGYALASRINKLINADAKSGQREAPDSAEVVIEQARAFIEHTTPERFQAADSMLEQALARAPDDADLQVALATHRLRGIQTDWYPEGEKAAKQSSAESMLRAVLKAKPTYLPALEGYCRFLTATNRFVESLVACAQALAFDPWDGTALYEMGLSQLQLGRFEEALASFKEADQFDVPRVSRWTWSLGAGLACLFLDRNEEAVAWLQKSIAITPGTGRSYIALAAAYQKSGKPDEARRALAKGLEMKPDATLRTFALPGQNASPVFLEGRSRLFKVLIGLGLPES